MRILFRQRCMPGDNAQSPKVDGISEKEEESGFPEYVSKAMEYTANPESESKPLNTELETLTPEETSSVEVTTDTTHNPTPVATATGETEPDYDAADFAAALENFDREQAADAAAAQSAMEDDKVVTGTVVKITDKHVVVDIGLKSEGLIPKEQVLDHSGEPKLAVGDAVEVVVEHLLLGDQA